MTPPQAGARKRRKVLTVLHHAALISNSHAGIFISTVKYEDSLGKRTSDLFIIIH
jgi:hypothetical protein